MAKTAKKSEVDSDKQKLKDALEAYRAKGGLDDDGFAKRTDSGSYLVPYTTHAKEYGVSRKTFEKTINKTFKNKIARQLFSDDEERTLVQFINLRATNGNPMTEPDIRKLGEEFLNAKRVKMLKSETNPEVLRKLREPQPTPSRHWANNFMTRHQDEVMIEIKGTTSQALIQASVRPKVKSNAFENECQKCLKSSEPSDNIWVCCGGGCNRWYHYRCVPDFDDILINIEETIKQRKWLCPTCEKWGRFDSYQ